MSGASAATVLITENLADLNRPLVESSYSAKIRVDAAHERGDPAPS